MDASLLLEARRAALAQAFQQHGTFGLYSRPKPSAKIILARDIR